MTTYLDVFNRICETKPAPIGPIQLIPFVFLLFHRPYCEGLVPRGIQETPERNFEKVLSLRNGDAGEPKQMAFNEDGQRL